ncbi:uridine kinase [Plantactinospora sp. KBS50]|uniref:uridine kinase n=1 Tax=Plantactinospora sp. KBS50 TaxID=2024580 RepID=UPI000BAAA9FC|nr:uridine kinase [Plantactinospora sp. KBS50]ASW57673.1 uridine kinase [Plantactinospora sp. KBS50]
MRYRPIAPDLLVAELADRIAGVNADGRVRVALDGAPAAAPDRLGAALVDPLRVRGRPAVHLRSTDFLRPASLRYEQGRTNPDSYYLGWLDEAGLRREVLEPAGPSGSGRILPTLWNAETDRASRAGYLGLPDRSVVLVSGPFLLGGPLPFDLSVHLALSPAALARRAAERDRWTLPAYRRYAEEVDPVALADLAVRVDDPRHPALLLPPG